MAAPFHALEVRTEEIASASERIVCIVMATSDLLSQMAARVTHERTALLTSLSLVILAARAYNRGVVDGIHSKLNDTNAFEYACRMGRDMGFDGKTLIHPAQVALANQIFAPCQGEIELAKRQIQAFDAAAVQGLGVAVVDGKIVENLHVEIAHVTLAKAEAIAKLEMQV